MDEGVRELERRVRSGDTDALAQYVQACVRAHTNMYEFLPLFVENRKNADLRSALHSAGLGDMRHYGNRELLEMEGKVSPSGNLVAFNHLMYEYSNRNTPYFLAETATAIQTPSGLKFTVFKGTNYQGIEMDLSDGAVRDQSNPKILDFLFGNLRSQYMTQASVFTISHYLGAPPRKSYELNMAFSFLTGVGGTYALRINTSIRRSTDSPKSCVGVPRIAIQLLSPPEDKQ